MQVQTTHRFHASNEHELRPCAWCATIVQDHDEYCAECGKPVYDFLDELITWKPDPNLRSLEERPYGAALAKKVRKIVKPFGMRVTTQDGYYVRVEMVKPEWAEEHNKDATPWEPKYHHRYHNTRYFEAMHHVEAVLHRLFFKTAGITDDSPGADYHYLVLPILSVR